MSLYGNIASTAPFQFDRIFSSRTEMDQKLAPAGQFVDDGVFVGRYVLIKYSTQVNSVPVAIVKSSDYDKLQKAVKGETVEPFVLEQGGETIKISATDSRVVVGTMFAVAPIDASSVEHYPDLANKYFFFVCVGADEETHEAKFDLQYSQDEYRNQSTGEYAANYNLDYENYGDQQGFDGTIWMKTYASVDDKYIEQYIQVGSINSSMPRLKVTPEAPTDKNQWRIPHLKTEGNTYDLHIQPIVGLRVGKTTAERVNKIGLDGQILSDTCPDTTKEVGALISDCANRDSIYFNKAGFNDSVSYHDTDRPNEISVELTGQSGQIYQSCTTGETGVQADTYELRMSLPALGNSVATMWDLAYGTNRNKNIAWEDGSVVNRPGERLYKMKDGGYGYNTEGVKSMAGCINSLHDLMGMIIITKNKENENDPDVINANNTFTNFGYENIYYFPNKKKYYRLMKKPQIEGKNQLSGDDYKYTGFTVSPDTYVAGLYYNDANGNSAANDVSINSEKTLYKRSLSDKGLNKVYNEIPNAEMGEITNESIYHAREHGYYLVNDLNNIIEGNKYCVLKIDLAEITSYIPGVYYKKDPTKPNAGYQLDLSETASETSYYKMVTPDGGDKYDIDISRNWVGEYPSGEEYRYYYTDEIVRKSVEKLQQVLGTDLPIKGDNVFFKYDNTTGIYQPYDETADVCYIGLRWKPTIDWDDDSKQFIQIQYPTEWVPVKLIMPASQSIYYYDPALGYKEFDVNHYVSDFVNYVAGKYSEVSTTSYVYRQFMPVSFDAGHDIVYYADGYGNYLKAEKPLAAGIMYYNVKETKTFKYVYEPNKYYYKSGNEYRLDSSERKTSGRTYYTLSEIVVADDTKGYYPVNSLWNVKTDLIPPSVTLATLSYQPQLVEMESFAEQMNTAHGLLLKINNVLESENTLTRSMNTVKGALNQIKDLLSKFDTMNPGNVVMVDGYGRLNSAEFGSSSWIKPVVKPDPEKPVVTFEHAGPAADGAWATPVITEDNNKQSVVLSVKVDTKGHIDPSNLKGVEPGNLLFTINNVQRTFAEWITWAANQGGGGTSAVTTTWNTPSWSSDNSKVTFTISQGTLRADDASDVDGSIWTLVPNNIAATIGAITAQSVTLNISNIPTNKQFSILLGYSDNNKFSNHYTATTVTAQEFKFDLRTKVAKPVLTQGTNGEQNKFTVSSDMDSNARVVKVSVGTWSKELSKTEYKANVVLDLDTMTEGLTENAAYKAKFQAISNNESYQDSEVVEFDYTYKKVFTLDAPTGLKFVDYKATDGVTIIGQTLVWDAFAQDGVSNITYAVYKDGTNIANNLVSNYYNIEKGDKASISDLNGQYQVQVSGMINKVQVSSSLSQEAELSWFVQLKAPVISLAENGKTISWEAIDNASEYQLINGANTYRTQNLFYTAFTAGAYKVKAEPSPTNGYKYFISKASNEVEVTESSVHEHSYDSTWDYDNYTHWHTCKTCSESIDEASHVRSIKYNSTGHQPACDVCDWTGAVEQHSYSSTQRITFKKGDYDSHYQLCDLCDYGKPTPHSWRLGGDHDNYAVCSVCGMTCDHSDSSQWRYSSNEDGQTHSITCLRCGQTFNTSQSCEFNVDNICTKCGQSAFVACSHPNKVLTQTGSGSDHKWQCPDCGESGMEAHVMQDYASANCQHGNQLKCNCGFMDDDGQIDETKHTTTVTEILEYVDDKEHRVRSKCDACVGYILRTEPHSFSAWAETSNGDYERECGCGETQTCDHTDTTLSSLNGTEHTVSCTHCPASWTESHFLNDDGQCECGYQCTHPASSYLYNSNNDGTHSITCGKCGATVKESAPCADNKNPRGTCDNCGGPMA